MPEMPPTAPAFDGIGLAKRLLREVRTGALATLERGSGIPFASLVTVATDHDGSPLLLLSRLSGHTLNLEADGRASILLCETGRGDPLAHPRLTVLGRALRVADPHVRARFLARHPKAKLYADFADFSFWRLEVDGAHLNGGFARAMTLTSQELRTEIMGAGDLLAVEEDALAHLNQDHREALSLYATMLGRAPKADWRASGLDPEGLDLAAGDLTARLAFPERIGTAAGLRAVLKRLAEEARAAKGNGGGAHENG